MMMLENRVSKSCLLKYRNENLVKHFFGVLALSICLMGSLQVQAQVEGIDYDWKLKTDKSGIKVFTSNVPGSAFRATLATMTVDAFPASIVALIMDLENCKKWIKSCKKARVLEDISATENYVYSVTSVPFPMKSRDMIGHVVWEVNSQTGKVTATGRAIPDRLELKKGLIRIEHADSNWHFTPLADGKTLVENYTHVDPNGPVPAFLVNLLLVGTPYNTFKGLRQRLKEGHYDNANLPF